jgi:hypothetical protein
MNQVSDSVKTFFEKYEEAINTPDKELIEPLYANSFMFGGQQGVQSIRKEDFLKVLPKQEEFFITIGLKSTKLVSVEETKIDNNFILVKANWIQHYEKNKNNLIDNKISATYVLFLCNNSLQIVMQIDHQDLMERVRELGLM